jgi:[acyl-carrier-protein] S-malonyltransferase
MTPIFMFPGQSSRYAGMLELVLARAPEVARPIVAEASEVLGRDLAAHYRADNEAAYASNRDVQVGVFLANHLHLRALEHAGVRAELSLGLSLGEYNHLVHIGALAFADALRLVDARGQVYDAGPEGAMASVFPLDLETLQEVVEQVKGHGPLEIGNLNSPTQNVLSGARAAVEAAIPILEEEHGCECVVIERRIPMHASIFHPAADALRPALEAAPWKAPKLPYLPNVTAAFEEDPTPKRIVELLYRHVFSPVRWRDSIDLLAARHPDAAFVEVGPKAVLYNLLTRKWRSNPRFKTDAPEGQPGQFDVVAAALRGEKA